MAFEAPMFGPLRQQDVWTSYFPPPGVGKILSLPPKFLFSLVVAWDNMCDGILSVSSQFLVVKQALRERQVDIADNLRKVVIFWGASQIACIFFLSNSMKNSTLKTSRPVKEKSEFRRFMGGRRGPQGAVDTRCCEQVRKHHIPFPDKTLLVRALLLASLAVANSPHGIGFITHGVYTGGLTLVPNTYTFRCLAYFRDGR